MPTSYCPMCSHCQRKKEVEEQLEIARLKCEERDMKERLAEEKRRERVAAKKLVEQGVIHGDDFDAYTIEEIRNITNIDFLEKMSVDVYVKPCGQPPNELDQEYVNERIKAINEQLTEVLINEME